eukprot:2096085-Rhodomonas_salina.2
MGDEEETGRRDERGGRWEERAKSCQWGREESRRKEGGGGRGRIGGEGGAREERGGGRRGGRAGCWGATPASSHNQQGNQNQFGNVGHNSLRG